MRKKLSIFLVLSFLLLLLPSAHAQAEISYNAPLRVGLYYDDTALASANLQNVTGYGSGYQPGWFDAAGQFTPLGYLPNVYLTMQPDTAWHLDAGLLCATLDEAQSYAAMLGMGAYPAYAGGFFTVRIGSYVNQEEAQYAAYTYGYTAAAPSTTGYLVTDTESGAMLFSFDVPGTKLGILPVYDPFLGNEGAQTWFKSRMYYGGFEYTLDGGKIAVTNVVRMEDYVRGVIPYEMSPSWPLEALKAQAVCARTYACANLGKHRADGFDLCTTTDCQVYYGTKTANAHTDQAVAETAGQYLTYAGEVIDAVFYATNGGASENSENVWYKALPYLRAVRDDFERQTNVSHKEWSFEITLSEITQILRQRGNDFIGSIVHAYATYTDAGNVASLVFIDSAGREITYTGERCRSLFNISGSPTRVFSQRFIFEDKHAMRIESNDEITSIAAGSLSAPTDSVYGSAVVSASSVLTADGVVPGAFQYGDTAPVLSADGVEDAQIVTTISGASGFQAGAGSTAPGGTTSAAALPIPTSCSGTFVVRGSGNGHNVGLSQYGAKAMAELGYTYEQILHFYYTNVMLSVAY